ncbi:MAG: hypothetical protein JNM56_21975 [Planctomycetia bacterium]|nr:hypothetical protein [Planctomycetia bacterium]
MDQSTLVSVQLDDGKRLMDRLVAEGKTVSAAAWVKERDGGYWYLYLATSLMGKDRGVRPAYRFVNAIVRSLQPEGFWIDPTSIKVIAPDDPLASAIAEVRNRYPAQKPFWYPAQKPFWLRGDRLGPLEIEEAIIYP